MIALAAFGLGASAGGTIVYIFWAVSEKRRRSRLRALEAKLRAVRAPLEPYLEAAIKLWAEDEPEN